MLDFDGFLKDLILNNRRVILPEIGSFIRTESGNMIFSSFLKSNDGFLEEALKQTGMSANESVMFVRNFIDNVKSTLHGNNRFYIADIGYLISDENGIDFVFNEIDTEINPLPIEEEKEPRKKIIALIGVAVLILLAIAFYFVKYKTNDSGNIFGFVVPNKPEHVTKTIETPQGRNLKYYLVVGCFDNKIQAERFLNNCKENGFINAEILPPIGELFPISVGRFSIQSEAEKQRNEYNSKFKGNAWLYKTY